MDSATDDRALPRPGCPIRRSPDQSLLSSSPELFAANHVLPRLLAPRHPPFALPVLTRISPLGRPGSLRTHPCMRKTRSALDSERYSVVKDRRSSPREPPPARSRPARPRGAERIEARRRPGGADRDRTDDLRLAKPALSQLSYSPKSLERSAANPRHATPARERWWAWVDSNYRPPAYQADALTN